MAEDSWSIRARTLSAERRSFDGKGRGGSHCASYLATWSFQTPGLRVVGTAVDAGLTTEAGKADAGIGVGKANSKAAAAVVRCKFATSQAESAEASKTVAFSLSSFIPILSLKG